MEESDRIPDVSTPLSFLATRPSPLSLRFAALAASADAGVLDASAVLPAEVKRATSATPPLPAAEYPGRGLPALPVLAAAAAAADLLCARLPVTNSQSRGSMPEPSSATQLQSSCTRASLRYDASRRAASTRSCRDAALMEAAGVEREGAEAT